MAKKPSTRESISEPPSPRPPSPTEQPSLWEGAEVRRESDQPGTEANQDILGKSWIPPRGMPPPLPWDEGVARKAQGTQDTESKSKHAFVAQAQPPRFRQKVRGLAARA